MNEFLSACWLFAVAAASILAALALARVLAAALFRALPGRRAQQ
jgi:hypothetical protein